jgi:hypothetical protein
VGKEERGAFNDSPDDIWRTAGIDHAAEPPARIAQEAYIKENVQGRRGTQDEAQGDYVREEVQQVGQGEEEREEADQAEHSVANSSSADFNMVLESQNKTVRQYAPGKRPGDATQSGFSTIQQTKRGCHSHEQSDIPDDPAERRLQAVLRAESVFDNGEGLSSAAVPPRCSPPTMQEVTVKPEPDEPGLLDVLKNLPPPVVRQHNQFVRNDHLSCPQGSYAIDCPRLRELCPQITGNMTMDIGTCGSNICERSVGTVFQLPNPDAIYSRDKEKERKVERHLIFVSAHGPRDTEAR